MSIRKEVLYSKARTIFNDLHKRVWFDINPFFDKSKNQEQFEFDRHHSKYLEPLRSIVVCERMMVAEPLETKEIKAVDFWDMLFSGQEHFRTMRVFDGELMDMLQHAFFHLETKGLVVSRQTLVYAKNKRSVPKCFQDGNIKGSFDVEETLRICFKYYSVYRDIIDPTYSGSTAYPSSGLTTRSEASTKSGDMDKRAIEIQLTKESNIDVTVNDEACKALQSRLLLDDADKIICHADHDSDDKHARVVIHTQDGPDYTHVQTVNHPTAFTSAREKVLEPVILPLSDLPCTETAYNKYGSLNRHGNQCSNMQPPDGGITLGEHNSSMTTASLDERFQKFKRRRWRLGATRSGESTMSSRTTATHIAEMRETMEKYSQREISATDLSRNFYAPTFEQCLLFFLEEDDYDPRYKINHKKLRRLSRKYRDDDGKLDLSRDKIISLMDDLYDVLSHAEKEDVVSPFRVRRIINERKTRRRSINARAKTCVNKGNIGQLTQVFLDMADNMSDTSITITSKKFPWVLDIDLDYFADIVVGITDCEPFRKSLLERLFGLDMSAVPTAQNNSSSDQLDSPAKIKIEMKEVKSQFGKKYYSSLRTGEDGTSSKLPGIRKARTRNDSTPIGQYSRKAKLKSAQETISDPSIEDEGSLTPPTMRHIIRQTTGEMQTFDVEKLNRRYSIERLRHTKRPQRLNTSVNDLLKKYVGIKKAVALLSTKHRRTRKRKIEWQRRLAQLCTTLDGSMMAESAMERSKSVATQTSPDFKTRLQLMAYPVEVIALPDFKGASLALFQSNLLHAASEFVIRKEMVTSSYGFKTITCFTFSCPDIFKM